MSRRLSFLIVGFLAWAPGVASAAGAIAGIVTAGPNATPITNARVRLVADPEQVSRTDSRGEFRFTSLKVGSRYAVTVEAEGLRPFTSPTVTVRDGEDTRLDVSLELATDVAVTVVERATDLRGGNSGRGVDQPAIQDLPSLTRSTTKYALLDPHVRQAIGLGADYQDSTRLSINAGSYRHTGFMLDGTTTYDWVYAVSPQVAVSPAAVSEMKVLTDQYSAQYGQSTTGVLSILTRSGGDRREGEAFFHIRPDAMQARPPLATFDIPFERKDVGFLVGGPIQASRTYFFASYEGARQQRGAYIQSPQPGFFEGENREQYGMLRLDRNLRPGNALTGRFNASEYTTNNSNDRVSGFNQPSFGRQSHVQSLAGQATNRLSAANRLNELRVSFVAYTPDSASPLQSSVQIARPNYSTEGFSTSNWVYARTFQVGDVLTLHRGRHDLKFGGEFVRLSADDYSFTPLGTYTFNPGAPQPGDRPIRFTQTFGASDLSYAMTHANAFVQDDLRLSSRVTANVGLRYEVQSKTDDHLNLGPRAGLAWDLSGRGNTVLRSGAGIFYDQYYMYLYRRYIALGPDSPQITLTWNAGDPGFPVFPNSFAGTPTGGLSGARDIMIPGDQRLNPYSRHLSLGLEHRLGAGTTLEIKGLHVHTFKQMRVNDINHPAPFDRTAPGQIRTTQAANLTRPFTTYGGVAVRDIAKIENTAESIYRSLDLGVTQRLSSWGRFTGRYVFSSSTAYSMFYADANSGVPNEWYPDWDRFEGGPSDFSQPHRFVADGTAKLPFDSQVSVVAIVASGLPVNPITGRDNNGDSYTVDRPVGFGRNSFRAPTQASVDVAGGKFIRLAPRMRVEVRLEVFNLFNRLNSINVNNIYGDGATPLPTFLAPIAGIVNSDPSRQAQIAMRFLF